MKAELAEVYRRMLMEMAAGGTQVVLGQYEPGLVELARSLATGRLFAVKLEEVPRFPYRAPLGHASPPGNRLLAEQFFAVLTGLSGAELPLVTFTQLERRPAPEAPVVRALDGYRAVAVGLEEGPPWRFVEIEGHMQTRDLRGDFILRERVKSLLALQAPGQLVPEAAFYPLPVELREGAPFSLRSARAELELGRVSLLRPDLQVGVVSLSAQLEASRPAFKDIDAVYKPGAELSDLLPGKVYLGEKALFDLGQPAGDGKVALRPLRRRFLQLYAPAELLGSAPERRSGVLSLRFKPGDGPAVRVPLAHWHRAGQDLSVRFDGRVLQRPIKVH